MPTKPRADDYAEEWGGRRHPSRRLNRPLNVPTANYHQLLRAVFAPPDRSQRQAPAEALSAPSRYWLDELWTDDLVIRDRLTGEEVAAYNERRADEAQRELDRLNAGEAA